MAEKNPGNGKPEESPEKGSSKRKLTRRKALLWGAGILSIGIVGGGGYMINPVSDGMDVALDSSYLTDSALEERTLEANGISQHYVIGKAAEGNPTLVFLHGTTANHTIFRNQIEYFRNKGYGVIAIDLRGDGKTQPKSADESFYSLENRVGDLATILEHEKMHDVHVVGHSMGGQVGMAYAAEHEEVKTLTIIESSPDFKKSLTGDAEWFFRLSWLLRPMFTGNNWAARMSDIEPVYVDFSKLANVDDSTFAKVTYERATPDYVQAMHALSENCMTWNVEDRLDAITVPTLIVGAEQSQFLTVESHYALQERIGDNARVVIIPNAKHQLLITNPDELNRNLEEFVEQYR